MLLYKESLLGMPVVVLTRLIANAGILNLHIWSVD